jgi:hypothetical protein
MKKKSQRHREVYWRLYHPTFLHSKSEMQKRRMIQPPINSPVPLGFVSMRVYWRFYHPTFLHSRSEMQKLWMIQPAINSPVPLGFVSMRVYWRFYHPTFLHSGSEMQKRRMIQPAINSPVPLGFVSMRGLLEVVSSDISAFRIWNAETSDDTTCNKFPCPSGVRFDARSIGGCIIRHFCIPNLKCRNVG